MSRMLLDTAIRQKTLEQVVLAALHEAYSACDCDIEYYDNKLLRQIEAWRKQTT